MRHVRSILYALVLAPAVWVLCAVGFTDDLIGRARDTTGSVEALTGLLLLLLAGAAYAILVFSPISPAGPTLAGLAFLGVCLWALAEPASYAAQWPPEISKEGFDLSLPGYGLALVLCVPMICTVLSARRWARYEPPVLPVIGRLGHARGAAAVAGVPISAVQTTVLHAPAARSPELPTQVIGWVGAESPTEAVPVPVPLAAPSPVPVPAPSPASASASASASYDGEATTLLPAAPGAAAPRLSHDDGEPTTVISRRTGPATDPASDGEATTLIPRPAEPATDTAADGEATTLIPRPAKPVTDQAFDGEATTLIPRPAEPASDSAADGEATTLIPRPAEPAADGEPITLATPPAEPAADTEPITLVTPPAEPAIDSEPITLAAPPAKPAVDTATDDEPTTTLMLAPSTAAPSVEPLSPPVEPAVDDEPGQDTPVAPSAGLPSDTAADDQQVEALEEDPAGAVKAESTEAEDVTETISTPKDEPTQALTETVTADVADASPAETAEEPTAVSASTGPTADDEERTQLLRLPSDDTVAPSSAGDRPSGDDRPTGDLRPAAAQTANGFERGRPVREFPPGEKTQVIARNPGETTQVIRHAGAVYPPPGETTHSIPMNPQAAEPPGERTQVIKLPAISPTSATSEPAAGPPSIADAERPDPADDPTTRLVPAEHAEPDGEEKTAEQRPGVPGEASTVERTMTVTNMERPADEAEEDTRPLAIPAQRQED